MPQPGLDVYISYARKDEKLLEELETHLALLQRQELIRPWHRGLLVAGDRREESAARLADADVVLLLISADFLASDDLWTEDVQRALRRHEAREARVVPVTLRPCDWTSAPFGRLEPLPRDGRPVTSWEDRDEAFADVAGGLRAAIEDLRERRLDRTLSAELETLYERREELTLADGDTRDVDREIRDRRRRLRKGPQLRPGEFLADGRFKLDEPLGKGGFATVWKAYDRTLRRVVAAKVLHGQHADDRSRRERFFRGARKMAELVHPHVVAIVELELVDDGWYFFVMEHVAGGDFRDAVLAGRLSVDERLDVVHQVGKALDFAHRRGIVHRDVKPSNVLLDDELGAKLTDFDLVRAEDTTGLTATRAMMGTLLFAAPEALEAARDVGPPSDVYSLGSTAVFALRGEALPPDYYRDPGPTVAELEASDEMKGVLGRALALEAGERFSSVREFCNALDRARPRRVAIEAVEPMAEPVVADQRSPSRVGRWLAAAAVAVLVVFAGWISWSRWRTPEAAEEPAAPPAEAETPPPPTQPAVDQGIAEAGSGLILATRPAETIEPRTASELIGAWEERIGMRFHRIPAGEFRLGSPPDEEDRDDDETLHEVELTRGFWMAETEVTQRQWKKLIEKNPSYFSDCDDCPVERVSWYEAVGFANRLSTAASLSSCYELSCRGTLGGGCNEGKRYCAGDYRCGVSFTGVDCKGYRLPTEAEWEYAARAETQSATYAELNGIAWYSANSDGHTHSVGGKTPNGWDLKDMLGNVREWTGDWFDSYPLSEGAAQDPIGPERGSYRVVRGGSWIHFAEYCRSADRDRVAPGYRNVNLGFRLVRTLPSFP